MDEEKRYYYKHAGLIAGDSLLECPYCMVEPLSILVPPFMQVLPLPSFGVDAVFSPLNMDIEVRIVPAKKFEEL